KALERRARELQNQARQLEERLQKENDKSSERLPGKSGLGADLQPVPEPTVRDLSVSQARPAKAFFNKSAPPKQEIEEPAEPVEEVITATEIAAATTAEILGEPG